MRVLVLAQYFPPDMGGGATRAYNIAKGLSLTGCDVTVVAAFPHYPTGKIPERYSKRLLTIEQNGKLNVIRTFVPPFPSEGFVKRIVIFVSFLFSSLFALPSVGKIDVIWAANPNVISMFPSLIFKLINRCSIVQNVDDLWPEALYDLGLKKTSFVSKLGELIAKFTYTISSAITPISPAYVDILEKKYSIDSNKINVIEGGVDLATFKIVQNKDEIKKFRVVYVGAFSPAYDFDQVFKTAESLLSFKNIEFILQGGGELAHDLKSKLKKAGLTNLQIIDKIVPRSDVAKTLNAADALLLPLNGGSSIELGISSKLYEYQAAGKPILCCSCGQSGQYVLRTHSGVVIQPKNFDALAKAVITLSENKALCKELGDAGRLHVENNLSLKHITKKMKNVLDNVVGWKTTKCLGPVG